MGTIAFYALTGGNEIFPEAKFKGRRKDELIYKTLEYGLQ